MSDSPNADSFWKASRIAIITTLIAMILNPISIIIGYYLAQTLQAPRLKIEYVTVDVETAHLIVDEAVFRTIQNDLGLRQLLKRKLPFSCNS